MSMCVVNMQKYGSGALGGLQSHNQREHESKKNREIDAEKSYLNYDLINSENINYQAAVKERIAALELKKAVRKDAVVYCSFIVGSDREFFHLLAYKEHVRRENQNTSVAIGLREPTDFEWCDQEYKDDCMMVATEKYFRDAAEFFQRRFGKENVLNATVHLDEPQGAPHMHLGLVPVTPDGRLSAKKLFTPETLRQLQTDFAAEVGEKFGLERGREGSTAKHIDEVTFKLQKRQEALQNTSDDLWEASTELRQVRGSVEALRAEEAAVTAQIEQKLSSLEETSGLLEEVQKDLTIAQQVLREVHNRGERQLGAAEWQLRIAEKKQLDTLKQRVSLFERFVEHPKIKPLWEQFLAMRERSKAKKRTEQEQLK